MFESKETRIQWKLWNEKEISKFWELLKKKKTYKNLEIWNETNTSKFEKNFKYLEIQTFLNNIPSILFLFLERIPGHNLPEINISVRNITLTIILYQW